MEPVAAMVDKLQNFSKDLSDGLFNRVRKSKRRTPIEILKGLQKETFSDIMKLRDREDKVEKMLALNRSSTVSPFPDNGTHVRGAVDVLGALFFMDGIDEQKYDTIQRSGIRTGIDARMSFQTVVREKDKVLAEFVASERGKGVTFDKSLSLTKVSYAAHVNDWFSAIAIPMGAQCRDFGLTTSSPQERGLTNYSEFGPPLLNHENGGAIGITVRKSNVVASLAQFVSGLGMQRVYDNTTRSFSTFGQVVWRLPNSTELSVLSVYRQSRPSNQSRSLGELTMPISMSRLSDRSVEDDSPPNSDGCIALTLNSQLDESTRLGGWIEMKNSNPISHRWAMTICDTPKDEFGWGLTVGGSSERIKIWDHLQVESYLSFNFSKRFKLQPGLLFVKDGPTQFPALMLRSSWSI